MEEKSKKALKLLLGLFALITIVLVAILIPASPQLFQGSLEPTVLDDAICRSLTIKTVPQALTAYQSGTIIIETEPSDWPGPFTVSASSGTLRDPAGNEGSLLETNEKIINFSGGDPDSVITAQADASGTCIGSLKIEARSTLSCESLTISTYPEPPPANESLEITINPSPSEWMGSFLIQAESGRLTLTDNDPTARGVNTDTLVTGLNKIIYNGGRAGEAIAVRALGEGNERCDSRFTIGTE